MGYFWGMQQQVDTANKQYFAVMQLCDLENISKYNLTLRSLTAIVPSLLTALTFPILESLSLGCYPGKLKSGNSAFPATELTSFH